MLKIDGKTVVGEDEAMRSAGIKNDPERMVIVALQENIEFYPVGSLYAYEAKSLARHVKALERTRIAILTGTWRNGRIRAEFVDRECTCGAYAVNVNGVFRCADSEDFTKSHSEVPYLEDSAVSDKERVLSGVEVMAMLGFTNRERMRQFRIQEGIRIIRIGGTESRQALYVAEDVEKIAKTFQRSAIVKGFTLARYAEWEANLKKSEAEKGPALWKGYMRSTQFDGVCETCGGFAVAFDGLNICENGHMV